MASSTFDKPLDTEVDSLREHIGTKQDTSVTDIKVYKSGNVVNAISTNGYVTNGTTRLSVGYRPKENIFTNAFIVENGAWVQGMVKIDTDGYVYPGRTNMAVITGTVQMMFCVTFVID